MNDEPKKPPPDPLDDVLRKALSNAPELVPGMTRQPYRRGEIGAAVARRRRKYGR